MQIGPADRDWLEGKFSELHEAFSAHVKEDESRLTRLEEWRRTTDERMARRASWFGLLGAGIGTGLFEWVRTQFFK